MYFLYILPSPDHCIVKFCYNNYAFIITGYVNHYRTIHLVVCNTSTLDVNIPRPYCNLPYISWPLYHHCTFQVFSIYHHIRDCHCKYSIMVCLPVHISTVQISVCQMHVFFNHLSSTLSTHCICTISRLLEHPTFHFFCILAQNISIKL